MQICLQPIKTRNEADNNYIGLSGYCSVGETREQRRYSQGKNASLVLMILKLSLSLLYLCRIQTCFNLIFHFSYGFAIIQASLENVTRQITEGKKRISSASSESFALIIDGKSLTYALDDGVKKLFLELAITCGSVICCRSSPKQKALVSFFSETVLC